MIGGKNILKEAGVVLIVSLMVLSSLMVTANKTNNGTINPKAQTVLLDEDFEDDWGPYGDNPPAGWQIFDFGSESPPSWNDNDWHKYYNETMASNTARVLNTPHEQMEEWLITPPINCSAFDNVTLRFMQKLYFPLEFPGHGIISLSIDDGVTWSTIFELVNVTYFGFYIFDISSFAAHQPNVHIRFRYYQQYAEIGYWIIDNVEISGGSGNQRPAPPTITGEAKGEINTDYDYSFMSIDPNDDYVYYYIDFGDQIIISMTGPYFSGETVTFGHQWSERGTYTIKAKAKDMHGAESDWAILSVKIPYSYNLPFQLFWERLFELFPHIFPILRHLLGY
jgi:hypothetical protein